MCIKIARTQIKVLNFPKVQGGQGDYTCVPLCMHDPAQHMHIDPALRCACSYDIEFTCGAEVIVVNFLFDSEGPMDVSLLRLDVAAKESISDETLFTSAIQTPRVRTCVSAI